MFGNKSVNLRRKEWKAHDGNYVVACFVCSGRASTTFFVCLPLEGWLFWPVVTGNTCKSLLATIGESIVKLGKTIRL
jgi:hypothetical protein